MRAALGAALLWLGACGSGPSPEAPGSAPSSAPASAAQAVAVGEGRLAIPPGPPDPGRVVLPGPGRPLPTVGGGPNGAPCAQPADCASGICEGEGCDGQGPVCRPAQRMCTKDLRSYCGCDGGTFFASGSCPGRPYQARGPCAAPDEGARTPCQDGKDCPSGVCEGQGCDGSGPTCRPLGTMCTLDLVPYCGCNQITFHSSGTCAGRPYAARGPCSGDAPEGAPE